MSLDSGSFVPERFEYHEAKLFIRQDIQGKDKDYSGLKEAYQITILSMDRFFPDEELIHSFQYYDPVNGVSLNGKTRIVILELAKACRAIEKPVCEMLGYEAQCSVIFFYCNKFLRNSLLHNELRKLTVALSVYYRILGSIFTVFDRYKKKGENKRDSKGKGGNSNGE